MFYENSFIALACTLKLQGIQILKETTQVIEFSVTNLPVRAMIGRLDFSGLLEHASALLVHCLGKFFLGKTSGPMKKATESDILF